MINPLENKERKMILTVEVETYGTHKHATETRARIEKELALQGFRFNITQTIFDAEEEPDWTPEEILASTNLSQTQKEVALSEWMARQLKKTAVTV